MRADDMKDEIERKYGIKIYEMKWIDQKSAVACGVRDSSPEGKEGFHQWSKFHRQKIRQAAEDKKSIKKARESVVLRPEDLKIEPYRPPGSGVNEGCVGCKITHLPTGASANFHKSRFYRRNEDAALEKLKEEVITIIILESQNGQA